MKVELRKARNGQNIYVYMYSNFHCLTKGLEALGELFLTLLLPLLLLDTWSEILTTKLLFFFVSHTSRPFCCFWRYWPLHRCHPPRVHICNLQCCSCLVQIPSVRLVPNSVCQQQAVWACQTLLWYPSRFCPGACSLHLLCYPSGLHHQPSQLESPLVCQRHSAT